MKDYSDTGFRRDKKFHVLLHCMTSLAVRYGNYMEVFMVEFLKVNGDSTKVMSEVCMKEVIYQKICAKL